MDGLILENVLARQADVSIGIVGDFCLDAYWECNARGSEISVETGLATRAVERQRYSLGGAGNVAANLSALGAGRIECFGVVGEDPFGRMMLELFHKDSIGSEAILVQKKNWETNTYIKPIEAGTESNRLDIGNFNQLADQTAQDILERLEKVLPELDVLIINQQLQRGVHNSPKFSHGLLDLIAGNPHKHILFDSRSMSQFYKGTVRKLNAYEACVLKGLRVAPGSSIGLEDCQTVALALHREWGRPLVLTRGDRGCLVVEDGRCHSVPGLHIIAPTDSVGAGDSMLAGLAAGLAAGCSYYEAATLGNFVAGVTVQKRHETGTATPAEVLAIGRTPEYVYQPEKAEDIRKSNYVPHTEIELVEEWPQQRNHFKCAIFDHDGTISTLREGWEGIMEPMMIKAILGDAYTTVDTTTLAKLQARMQTFIEATTGIQTLIQMQGLVELVAEFGFVPKEQMLDAFGYKKVYDCELKKLIAGRMQKLTRGELSAEDFIIKGARQMLQFLHERGVRLYLASGTDEEDVIIEAKALGYAELFDGGIYGSVGDMAKDAKRLVMDRIINEIGQENSTRMVVFGDGPVELRESRMRGGYAVGIASDDVRRYGLNLTKRKRLIRAGAHVIVPDFSQLSTLVACLGWK